MIIWLMKMTGLSKPLVIGAMVVFAILAAGVGKCAYDRSVIKSHEAERDASIAKADRKADAKAAEERRVDDARATAETQEIKEAVNEARSEGRDPRAAYYECIRLQQAARASGQPPADC